MKVLVKLSPSLCLFSCLALPIIQARCQAQGRQSTPPPAENQVKLTVLDGLPEGPPLGYTIAQVFPTCNQSNMIGVAMSREGLKPGAGEMLQLGQANAAQAKPYSTWDGNHLYINWTNDHYSSSTSRLMPAHIRIDLGPNLAFADGSHIHEEIIAPRSTFDIEYFKIGGPVKATCDATRGKGNESYPYTKYVADSSPIECPHLQEIRDGVRQLNAIAAQLQTDDAYYRSAVADTLMRGYDSPFAKLALYLEDNQIAQAFGSEQYIAQNRESFYTRLKLKADIRQQLATAMYAKQQGQEFHPNKAYNDIAPITSDVATFFCTADPNKLDIASWDVLYWTGYTSYPFHRDVKAKMQSNAVLGPVVLAANGLSVASAGVTVLKVAGPVVLDFAIDSGEIGVMRTIAGRSLVFTIPKTIGTIEKQLSAEEANALVAAKQPPFRANFRAFLVKLEAESQFVRFDYGSEEGNWLIRRSLVVDQRASLYQHGLSNSVSLFHSFQHTFQT